MTKFLDLVAAAGPELSIRATVLYVAACGLALALRRGSAADRHLVWAAVLAGGLTLPLIHAIAPGWHVLPTAIQASNRRAGAVAKQTGAISAVAVSSTATVGSFPFVARAGAEPKDSPALTGEETAAGGLSVGQGLAALWLVGVLFFAARLALAFARLWHLTRRAAPATRAVATLLAELPPATGIRRPVRGFLARDAVVPMTWGWLCPAVLLPADAGSWPVERLRVVLLHELAHIRRGDFLTQLGGELARGLFWFHPLSWWSLRRLRAEQEAACDDCVLAAGVHADDYAEDLLAVTARLPAGLRGAGVALAMAACASRIEARIRAILAADRDRRPVGGVRLALVAGLFVALATVAAVVVPAVAQDETPRPPAEPAPATTRREAGAATTTPERTPDAVGARVPRIDSDTTSVEAPTEFPLVGTWVDTASTEEDPGLPLEILKDENGLWVLLGGVKAPLATFADAADVEAAAPAGRQRRPSSALKTEAVAVIDAGFADRHLRIERATHCLVVAVFTVFKDGSGRPNERLMALYANRRDFLPNGYEIFFANRSEAAIVKEGVNFGACIAGPHVRELGHSGNHIFGRIDPKEDLPPHPDHAPGFFLIDSATDKATTGLDWETWLAELKAVGIEAPQLRDPFHTWPKKF